VACATSIKEEDAHVSASKNSQRLDMDGTDGHDDGDEDLGKRLFLTIEEFSLVVIIGLFVY
jgi:hypothetical protein